MDNTEQKAAPRLTKAQRIVKAALSHGKYRQFLAQFNPTDYVGTANKCYSCPFHNYLTSALGMERSSNSVGVLFDQIAVVIGKEVVRIDLNQEKYAWLRGIIRAHDKHSWRITAAEAIEDVENNKPKPKAKGSDLDLWNGATIPVGQTTSPEVTVSIAMAP